MIHSSTNVISLKLKIIENEVEKKIWIHNIYNFSSTFYSATNSVSTISMIEKCINEVETKHIVLDDFNLHHFLWNESSKLTQHAMTNKLIDVIDEANMKLTVFQETITWQGDRGGKGRDAGSRIPHPAGRIFFQFPFPHGGREIFLGDFPSRMWKGKRFFWISLPTWKKIRKKRIFTY